MLSVRLKSKEEIMLEELKKFYNEQMKTDMNKSDIIKFLIWDRYDEIKNKIDYSEK